MLRNREVNLFVECAIFLVELEKYRMDGGPEPCEGAVIVSCGLNKSMKKGKP